MLRFCRARLQLARARAAFRPLRSRRRTAYRAHRWRHGCPCTEMRRATGIVLVKVSVEQQSEKTRGTVPVSLP